MTVQLIFNEKDVKDLSPISQNLAGEYLGPAMFEAQEIGLENILGSRLLDALKDHETAGDWEQYPAYADLRNKCRYYLIYQTIVNVIPKVSFKIANAGAVQTSDTNVQNLAPEKIDALTEEYQGKADYFCYKLQRWICANRAQFAELTTCQCEEIEENLRSMATCGIWLGGPRGYMDGEECC